MAKPGKWISLTLELAILKWLKARKGHRWIAKAAGVSKATVESIAKLGRVRPRPSRHRFGSAKYELVEPYRCHGPGCKGAMVEIRPCLACEVARRKAQGGDADPDELASHLSEEQTRRALLIRLGWLKPEVTMNDE